MTSEPTRASLDPAARSTAGTRETGGRGGDLATSRGRAGASRRRFCHALVIGKFYPPHRGHHAAIRAAAETASHVTVVVMASARESMSLADRVAVLRAVHAPDRRVAVVGVPCDAPLDAGDPRVWAAQIATMRAALQMSSEHGGCAEPIDAVVCGDAYGTELAARFEATLVAVARDGLSGTAIRADIPRHWDDLAADAQAALTVRAVFVGAESTGTTTVSRLVAAAMRARGGVWGRTGWVAEYGRDYTDIKWDAAKAAAERAGRKPPELTEITWDADDFDLVAAEQTRREQAAAAAGSPVLVCDTDAFATWIWKRRYLGGEAAVRQPAWARPPLLPRRDLYFVTDHDGVPWHDDGLREGDLAIRAAMTAWFTAALTEAGRSWVLLTGSADERAALALATIDQMLAHRLAFAEPLHGPGFE